MVEQFWTYNFKDIYQNNGIFRIIPNKHMTQAQLWNSYSRFLILLIIIALIFTSYMMAIILLLCLIFLIWYYKNVVEKNFAEQKDKIEQDYDDTVSIYNSSNNNSYDLFMNNSNYLPTASNSYDDEIPNIERPILDPRMFQSVDINTREPDPIIKSNIANDQLKLANWNYNNISPSVPLY